MADETDEAAETDPEARSVAPFIDDDEDEVTEVPQNSLASIGFMDDTGWSKSARRSDA